MFVGKGCVMFRVAEFERKGRKLIFKKFLFRGFKIGQDGSLWRGSVKQNTRDRRKRKFYEINMCLIRKDMNGVLIYEKDICMDRREKIEGVIRYLFNKSAFLIVLQNGMIEVPYSYLDFYEVSLEVKGNVYERI